MSANSVAPGAQQKRFAAHLDRLAHAAGHLDRVVPLKSYWGSGSNRAEIYSKERFFGLRGVLFGSELAKTTEPCVKFLRERPVSRKVRIQSCISRSKPGVYRGG